MDEAYAPLPRKYQQDVVDQTFRSISRAPRTQQAASNVGNFISEGYRALNEGRPELREKGVQFAEITNPRHWVWQMTRPLLKPEIVRGLEEAPGKTTFIDVPQRLMSDISAYGITSPVPVRGGAPRGMPRDVQVAISDKAMQSGIGEVTGMHELTGHALPMTTSGKPFPYTNTGGMNVLQSEWLNPSLAEHTPEYIARLLSGLRGMGGAPHAAVELMANKHAVEAGVNPLIRDFKTIDPERLRSNIEYLRSIFGGF